jgi:tripartite-type tricarboxylate transporter receptor subunit TctC
VPPFAEVSGVPDFEAVSWHALVAPAAIPKPALDRLHSEMKRIMAAPEIKAKIESMGLIPQDVAGVEDTRRYVQSEYEKWGTLVRQLGLQGSM